MTRFYRNALFVLLLALAGLVATDSFVLRLEDSFFAKHRASWLAGEFVDPKVVLMGSSTVHYALSPEIIAEASGYEKSEIVNISGDAYTPLINEHIWRRYAAAFSDVRLVLYGIDPWIFYEYYYRTNDFMRLHWNYPQRIEYVRNSYNNGQPDIGLLTGMYSRRVLKRILEDRWRPREALMRGRDNGSATLRRKPASIERANARVFFGDTLRYPISWIVLERLRRLKEQVGAQGAVFVLVFPPKSRAWNESYQSMCSDIDAELAAAIDSRLGPVRTVASYWLFSDKTDFFVDHVHLGERGRRAFSEFIGESLAGLAAQRPRKLTTLSDGTGS